MRAFMLLSFSVVGVAAYASTSAGEGRGVDGFERNDVAAAAVVTARQPAVAADSVVYDVSTGSNSVDGTLVNPEFPGGIVAMMQFLNENIMYPMAAADAKISGQVIVQFIVNSEGKIVKPKVVRSVHPALDKEAVRVIMPMPKWTPGTLDGKPVAVRYTLPVTFRYK